MRARIALRGAAFSLCALVTAAPAGSSQAQERGAELERPAPYLLARRRRRP